MAAALLPLLLVLGAGSRPQEPVTPPTPSTPPEASEAGDAAREPAAGGSERRPNHLLGQTSPYLLQHLYNPVDWYPWGEEAFAKARAEDKPIFLSIGYSACHWCHVMERESFEDPEIAAFLNEHFVAVKVDREERPDVDEVYMTAVQKMTGSGGWPLTVFLTPDLEPFWGGTYFPPRSRYGRPGFLDVLKGIQQAWSGKRDEVLQAARGLDGALAVRFPKAEDAALPGSEEVAELQAAAVAALGARFDPEWGGFGPAPKFPSAETLRFLAHAAAQLGAEDAGRAREMLVLTLHRMAEGGLYDQVGGGFHRYSTDARWLVPHFEKMLYDQGTLMTAYLEGYRLTGDDEFARIVRETADYLLRDLRLPGGAFAASTDADSEGEEGRFFTWTPNELRAALGERDAGFVMRYWGVTDGGNFEGGRSILHVATSLDEALAESGVETDDPRGYVDDLRRRLWSAREERVHPHMDDKVIVGWNALAVEGLAHADLVLGEERYLAAATEAARFLIEHLRDDDGWRRSWRLGEAQGRAVLEDEAFLARAFLALFEATGDEAWLDEAHALADDLLARFLDPESHVFWNTDGADPHLRHRFQSPWDGALPSPNAVALETLLVVHALTRDEAAGEAGRRGVAALLPMLQRSPTAFPSTLRILPWAVEEPAVGVVVGTGDPASLAPWRAALCSPEWLEVVPVFRVDAAPDAELELFADRIPRDGKATLYLCRGAACEPPRTEP